MDFSQVAIASVMVQLGKYTNVDLSVDLLRHMILNVVRSNNKKFSPEYGELVIAADNTNIWRKERFPYYKANRKKSRDKDEVDWNQIFTGINTVRDELKEYFPYRVLHVDRAEADDVISTLCHEFGAELGGDKILILSGDKDFGQLQKFSNVRQYDPTSRNRDSWIKVSDPTELLISHIIKGDVGDGVPNVLSDDDTFVTDGKRQVTMTEKRFNAFREAILSGNIPEENRSGYERNRDLIDLSRVPDQIKQATMEQYRAQEGKGRSKLFNYFVEKKLVKLLDTIGDF